MAAVAVKMGSKEPLSDLQAEFAAFEAALLAAQGDAVWVESPEHPGEVGLSLVDEESHKANGVVVVVLHLSEGVMEVGLPVPSDEELSEAVQDEK